MYHYLCASKISVNFDYLCIQVEELMAKERELQEKLMAKHSTIVDCYEKKIGGKELENRVASQQQKIVTLKQEVEDLVDYIDEI